ncbi:MAG: hypothetical protein GIW98_03360 [Candidatus Eremiobacteraeota bacterium]|nr:hypothetical protein [Candidatus Eremiobacteraeota bacterium]
MKQFWTKLTFSDYVNVSVLAISLISIFIALSAYKDARNSGREQALLLSKSEHALEQEVKLAQDQKNALEQELRLAQDQKNALDNSVSLSSQYLQSFKSASVQQLRLLGAADSSIASELRTAEKQQGVLQKGLSVSSEQLAVARLQWSDQLALRRAKPRIIFTVGDINYKAVHKFLYVGVRLFGGAASQRVSFKFRNIGGAALRGAILLLEAKPALVTLNPAGQVLQRSFNQNVIQESFEDIAPYQSANTDYSAEVDIKPGGVEVFVVKIRIIGQSGTFSSAEAGFADSFTFLVLK